jgi:hypothetical protein
MAARGRRAAPAGAATLASAAAGVLLAATAAAHEVGLSRGTYAIEGERVTTEIVVSQREIVGVVPELDADHDGRITDAEITPARPALQKGLVDRIEVRSNDAGCPGVLAEVHLAAEDGFVWRATYTCAAPVARARLDFYLLDDLSHGHRHIARSSSGVQIVETVMSRTQRTLELSADRSAASAPVKKAPPSLFVLGVERALTGYEHLVFLFGLLIVGGSRRSLLWIVASFTLACSIGLWLAALGAWAPRPAILGPAIALSIAYVGVESCFAKSAEKRWRIALPFGLVHGFGLAGALGEGALPKVGAPAGLFLFNAGVELGHLGFLAAVLPVLVLARKQPWFEKYGVRAASAAVALAGLAWLVVRLFTGRP